MHQLAHSVFRSAYLFVRESADVEMQTFQSLVSGTREVLYDTRSGETFRSNFPQVVGSLKESLDAHLTAGLPRSEVI